MTEKTATLDDLVNQVGNLTSATTDLLNATSTSKATLDQAVDEAKGHAQSADNANTSAVNAKEEAKTAASEAKKAEANATAIVHNDEGTTTPTPGAYPVADSKGHLDIGWTPLLAAMYPYSGVIGSVDKADLLGIWVPTQTSSSNKITLKERAFNIAGKFVKPPQQVILLPEAESTANRAIAFDDIFLDWNGTVTTYRSITSHRTTTGYDRDAIATEHGYSKIQKGLYKTGDTYALLLGRVARRNQGAYHPEFNPEGSRRLNEQHTGYWTNSYWFADKKYIPSNLEGYFQITTGDPEKGEDYGAFASSGNIYSGASKQGRPDQKPYDAIYADDFTPLYYSAKNVIDRQALLFDSFNRAVAGETFSGAEGGIKETEFVNGSYLDIFGISTEGISVTSDSIKYDTSNRYSYCVLSSKKFSVPPKRKITVKFTISEYTSGNLAVAGRATTGSAFYLTGAYANSAGEYEIEYTVPENKQVIGLEFQNQSQEHTSLTFTNISVKLESDADSARPQFLMVDIIGSLDAMPDEWKTHGIPGNWLAVGEEGESLIPDGTEKNFKLSRKCLECYQVLRTTDKGVTWEDYTDRGLGDGTWKTKLEGSTNSGNAALNADRCMMVFYRTNANPFELADNPRIIDKSSYCWWSNIHEAGGGSQLGSNLIAKITTSHIASDAVMTCANYRRGLFSYYNLAAPTHTPLPRTDEDMHAPALKVLPVLTYSPTSSLALQCIYKELKHNGTQWGDDNKFNIVDKQSTVTDLNGEKVIVGQKRVETFYQFSGETY